MSELSDEIVVTPKDSGEVNVEVKQQTDGEPQHFLPLAGMMNIQEPSKEDSEKLSTVWDYFKGDGKSNAEILYHYKRPLKSLNKRP